MAEWPWAKAKAGRWGDWDWAPVTVAALFRQTASSAPIAPAVWESAYCPTGDGRNTPAVCQHNWKAGLAILSHMRRSHGLA